MPRPDQLVNVSIQDKGKLGEKRKITVEIEGTTELFLLSDLLSKEGAIKDLEGFLRSANRKAVGDYVMSGKEFVKGKSGGGVTIGKGAGKRERQDKRIGTKFLQPAEPVHEK